MKLAKIAGVILTAMVLAGPASAEVFEVTYTSSPNLIIPDAGPPVQDVIDVTDFGYVEDIQVYLDVSIGYTSDLIIKLMSPTGTQKTVVFVDSGIPDPDIPGWWFPGDHAPWDDLSQFAGEEIQGDWTLICQDHSADSEGVLNEWRLKIFYIATAASESNWSAIKALF